MASETTFQRINREAEERRKQRTVEPLISYAYAHDAKSSKISTSDHQSKVDDELFGFKVEESLRLRPTEFDGIQLAANKPTLIYDAEPTPIVDKPNKYAGKKKCAHPDHEGDKYVPRSQFSVDKHHSDGLHSYCKACIKRLMRLAYVPKWRRGT